jgi:hypothetical protein
MNNLVVNPHLRQEVTAQQSQELYVVDNSLSGCSIKRGPVFCVTLDGLLTAKQN